MILYSAQQIAEMWNVSLSTIRRKEARGEMPPRYRISDRRYGYRQEDIAKWLPVARASDARSSAADPLNDHRSPG